MSQIKKRVMVTGGAGFIGYHFVKYLLDNNYIVLNYDYLSYAANLKNLEEFNRDLNYNFVKGDIRDRIQLDDVLADFQPDFIVNFAAETHVDRSIETPEIFGEVNFMGTLNILESIRANSRKLKKDSAIRYVQISTDEVYGTRELDDPATEVSCLAPSNVYAASKAGADLLALSYYTTYNLPVIVTRCCNNYGQGQYPEKFIPKILKCLTEREEIPIYGSGAQIRQWIHVTDHVRAVFGLMTDAPAGCIYNIGDNNFISNLHLAEILCRFYDIEMDIEGDKSSNLITYVSDRPGHDICYSIASQKIRNQTDWVPLIKFDSGLRNLVKSFLRTCA